VLLRYCRLIYTSCWSLVFAYGWDGASGGTMGNGWDGDIDCDADISWDGNIRCSRQCAEQDQLYSTVTPMPLEHRWGKVIIYLEGNLWHFQYFPASMWFLISLLCSSCISSQLLHFFISSFFACTQPFGISHLSFMLLVVNFLSTPARVVSLLVLRLIAG